MSLLVAAIVEKARRGRIEERLRGAIKNRFEVIPRRRWEPTRGAERVRCMEVYSACAEAIEVAALTTPFCQKVRAVVVKMGAVPIHPFNVHCFAFMRRRAAANDKATAAEWEAKLASEGLAGEKSYHHRIPTGVRHGAPLDARRLAHEMGEAHFDQARERYWKLERDRNILELYALEGRTIREIAAALDLGRDVVHRAITRLVAPGGQGDVVEDSDDGTEDG